MLYFYKINCSFRGKRNTLDIVIVILYGGYRILEILCCRFFSDCIGRRCHVPTRCRFRDRCGIFWDIFKIEGNLVRNIDFEVAKFQVPEKIRRKISVLKLWSVKNWRKYRVKCSFWCSCAFRLEFLVFLWPCRVYRRQSLSFSYVHISTCGNWRVEIRGSLVRSAFWCSHLFFLESLVFWWLRCVYGGSCKIYPCGLFLSVKEKWGKPRTKYSWWCSHASRLESLIFLWPRHVDGGRCKTSPSRRFPSRLSCRFAWQERHPVTFQPVW